MLNLIDANSSDCLEVGDKESPNANTETSVQSPKILGGAERASGSPPPAPGAATETQSIEPALRAELTSVSIGAQTRQKSPIGVSIAVASRESLPQTIDGLDVTIDGADASERLATRPLVAAIPTVTMDKYECLSLLGRGGMGDVYKARDLRLNRIVALKRIRGDDPVLAKRFLQEAHALARLDHPNLCRIYDVGQHDGKPYIVMQFVAGHSLEQNHTGLSLHDKVELIRDAALALHDAHRIGIIHRDIKPANIMIEQLPDGRYRSIVMDFGLARETGKDRGLTETGALMGTPAYMPPEQARGDARHLDRRADVYSLGATLYELLTERAPFDGEQVVDIILAVLNDEPKPLRALVSEIPIDLETIVLKCLAKERSERYDSTRALAEDLQRYIDGEPIQGKPRSKFDRLWRLTRRHKAISVSALAFLSSLPIVYGMTSYSTRRALVQRATQYTDKGMQDLEEARRQNAENAKLTMHSFAAFDSQNHVEGEALWSRAQSALAEADRAFGRAGQQFEAALAVAPSYLRPRVLLADSLLERALLLEREDRSQQVEELLQRLAVYDATGERRRRWLAPGHISLNTTPSGTRAILGRYEKDEQKKRRLVDVRDLGVTPFVDLRLEPGSYLLTLSAIGRIGVNYPFVIGRNGKEKFDVYLPEPNEVPPGFVYIPSGAFLFGSRAEEAMRKTFLSTVPIHPVKTAAYLIARNETTYGEWIDYLNSLPSAERLQQTVSGKGGSSGSVSLKQLPDGMWQIALQPTSELLLARADEPIVYNGRRIRKQQNWLRMPVGGILFAQARQYAQWLNDSGRLAGARLCDEFEWERAARGADDREWPHGDELTAQEANHDVTYDKASSAMGPDEVGSFPQTRSPFGIDDMAGNVFEWTYSRIVKDEPLLRSGSYWYSAIAQRSTNRNIFDPNTRDLNIGFRICITPSKSLNAR